MVVELQNIRGKICSGGEKIPLSGELDIPASEKTSLAEPQEWKREYLSNSGRLKYINRKSESRISVELTKKTMYEFDTI